MHGRETRCAWGVAGCSAQGAKLTERDSHLVEESCRSPTRRTPAVVIATDYGTLL